MQLHGSCGRQGSWRQWWRVRGLAGRKVAKMRWWSWAGMAALSVMLAACSGSSLSRTPLIGPTARDLETEAYVHAMVAGMIRAEHAREIRRSAERRK
jgi:hypothetical protein